MKHNLILIEGLPGTGKTTLSKQLFKLLSDQGIQVELLLEDNENSPSDFFNIAGVPKSDFTDLNDISPIVETDHYVFVNLENCQNEAATELQRYNVGDEFNQFVLAQEYAQCTLERWHYWVGKQVKDAVLILDSAFMQNPINEMIFRKAADSEIEVYIKAIAAIIKPLNPICIYLRRESAKVAIDFAKSVKGELWAKGIDGLANMGCSDLFKRRFVLEEKLLSLLPNIVCNIYGYDWSDTETKIQELVKSNGGQSI